MTSEQQQIVKQARAEYEAGLKFRHDREAGWKLAEDQYFNRQAKSLKQRYNVPVPIVPGFVETLLSKIDDPPTIKFEEGEEADYKAVQKSNAMYEQERQAEDHDWDMVDLDGKKQAILYGRAINKFFAQSKPKYQSTLETVDVYDFIADPIGGGNLEKHRFVMQDNLFKTKEDLKTGIETMGYDAQAVEKIINATSQDVFVDNDNLYKSKQSRFIALGMDGLTYNYAGQNLYKFIEAGTTWKGARYYVLFNYELGLGIKVCPQVEKFKSNLWHWTSWATHRDIFNFWSKAPVDDIIPLAEMIRVLFNQELDNRQKKNWGQRAYDPEVFPNPAELQWKPDGLVASKSGASRIAPLGNGLYQFETPELKGTIDMVQYMDSVIGQKTGVTADAQGSSEEDKVGIYYGNLQQVADRLGLYNKSYKKNWQAIGRRYVWGLFEHLRSPMAVRIIGEKGAEWDDLKRMEVNPDWNIKVLGGNAEMAEDEVKKKRLQEMMATLQPDELMITSPRWRAETKFRAAGVEEDDIRMAFDTQNEGNREILSEASMAIQEILDGKQPKLNRGANTAFVQKILDYATDNDLKPEQIDMLYAYAEAHIPIAQENMARKAVQMMAQKGIPPTAMGTPQPSAVEQLYGSPGASQPAPNTPAGTMSQSQQLSPEIAPV
jgi:hypothetical protein